jgi:hypothetical protein
MAVGPRRVVADELLMAALKVSNPIQSFIQVEGDDLLHRPSYFCLHRFIQTSSWKHRGVF